MPFSHELTIAWGDCDEAGIVFYPNYFYWMDSTFQALLRARSLSQRIIRDRFGALGTPIVDCGANFLAPATYDEVLKVEATVESWRDKGFRVSYQGTIGDTVVFKGFDARVWATLGEDRRMRAAPIPAAFKEMLS